MKPEEAIEKIKECYPPEIISESYSAMTEALEIAIEALEKQIARKPTRKPNRCYKCPSCKCEVGQFEEESYCGHCGQALVVPEEGEGNEN